MGKDIKKTLMVKLSRNGQVFNQKMLLH